jgi:GntR family transcriptional regulator/MocR family aminotransferase
MLPLLSSPLQTGHGALPRQRQVILRLKQAILAGRLPAGDRLPASRALALELGVSRNTVLIAYEQLAAEGYVVADRQGTRVAALSATSQAAARAVTDTAGSTAMPSSTPRTARRLDRIVPTRHALDRALPLTPGTPALDRFPLAAWRRAQDRALRLPASATLDYGDPAGEPALRQAIAQHLRISRGVRCDASRIIVTEGAQGALVACVQLLTNPGDHAWLEEPGYRGARSAFAGGDLHVSTLRVDADGAAIPPALWETHPPRLIQVTPSHQYPTGAVLSVSRRLDLLERARRAGAWIIEDDFAGAPVDQRQINAMLACIAI